MLDQTIKQLASPPMDLKSIRLREQSLPNIVSIDGINGILWGDPSNEERRIRREILMKLKAALEALPEGVCFMIYEAYRPLCKQVEYWQEMYEEINKKHSNMPEGDKLALCEQFVANPYNGIGSGHQAGCAIDVTLCLSNGSVLDMGTKYHEFSERTYSHNKDIGRKQQNNRRLLRSVLEAESFACDPAEWWHFSYGDHQWACLTSNKEAIYGPMDLC